MEAVKFTTTLTDRKGSYIGTSRSYQNSYINPVVIGQVMSANDANWSVFWSRGRNISSPPDSSNLWVGKMVGEDPGARLDETVGYLVIEAGTGFIDGIAYTAALGADFVRGYQNQPNGYSYPITGLTSASAAAVSQSAMDGGDGSWAVLVGANAITTGALTVVVDEDRIGDSERSHTTEQVGFLVLE
jgi:hypothetical protein